MEYILLPLIAAIAALLTLFSGFGVASILTPVFIIFFPVPVAVALISIIHLSNNIFKLTLLWKNINIRIALIFGGAALCGAFFGAKSLFLLSGMEPLYSYMLDSRLHEITIIKLIISTLLATFAIVEILPVDRQFVFSSRFLVPGGAISGFFGGLSGHQGALRSAFLLHCGLTKEGFIATGVLIACFVDMIRIPVYFTSLSGNHFIEENLNLIIITTLAAFIGTYAGKRLLKKITLKAIQFIVSAMIIITAIALGSGFI